MVYSKCHTFPKIIAKPLLNMLNKSWETMKSVSGVVGKWSESFSSVAINPPVELRGGFTPGKGGLEERKA